MLSYLSILKSYHINRHLSLKTFNTSHITLINKGGKKLFLKQKAMRLPIIKDILKNIMVNKPFNIDKLNIDTEFKVAWAGFLRLEKIMYINIELKKTSFSSTKVTRSNISFAKGNQYEVFYFKQSKTNTKYIEVQIIFALKSEKIYLIAALIRLYTLNLLSANISFFRLSSRVFS